MSVKFNFIFLLLTVFTVEKVLCDLNLLLLHNNDIQSQFEKTSASSGICQNENNCYGGFAKVIQAVKSIKQDEEGKRKVIFLNAGGTFQGSTYHSVYKWKVAADLIDRLNLDAMSLGSSEFADGVNGLSLFLNNITTVTVASNIDVTEEPSLQLPNLVPYKIIEVDNVKIAVIGYMTPDSEILQQVGKVKFLNEIESIQKQIDYLKANTDVKIFIALGHSGYNVDLKIAENIPDIDLVVGGKSKTFLYNGNSPDSEEPTDSYPKTVVQKSGKVVPVVQAYAFTKYLGYLKLDFNDNGDLVKFNGNPILLDNTFEEDKEFLSALEPWENKVKKVSKQVLGKTKVLLDARNHVCQREECNIGNAIVDAFIDINARKHKSKKTWTDAPIAFIDGGSIKTSIDVKHSKGQITYGDVTAVLPTKDHLVKGEIKGKYLVEVFENAVHRFKNQKQGVAEFLQVSGVKVEYTLSNDESSRVTSLKLRCGNCKVPKLSEVKDDSVYTIITTSRLAKGADKYSVLKKNLKNIKKITLTSTDAFAKYIKAKKIINPTITNRITFASKEETDSTTDLYDSTDAGQTSSYDSSDYPEVSESTKKKPEHTTTHKPTTKKNSAVSIQSFSFLVVVLASVLLKMPALFN